MKTIQTDAAAPDTALSTSRGEPTRDPCTLGRRTGSSGSTAAGSAVLAPGAYTYRTVGTLWLGDGESRALPRATVLTVCAPSEGGQWTVRDLGQADGHGLSTGLRLRSGTELPVSHARLVGVVAGGSPIERQWGMTTSGVSVADRHRGGSDQSDRRADGPVAVEDLGREEITVLGASIETIVRRISAGLRGRASDGYVVTQWLLPNGLVVREHGDARLTNGDASTYASYEAELLPQSWRDVTTGRPGSAS